MRGPIVTVPLSSLDIPEDEIQVERFHHACFRCGNCGDSFGELDGKANFVREDGKPVHVSVSEQTAQAPLDPLSDSMHSVLHRLMQPGPLIRSSLHTHLPSLLPSSIGQALCLNHLVSLRSQNERKHRPA